MRPRPVSEAGVPRPCPGACRVRAATVPIGEYGLMAFEEWSPLPRLYGRRDQICRTINLAWRSFRFDGRQEAAGFLGCDRHQPRTSPDVPACFRMVSRKELLPRNAVVAGNQDFCT
jgi:hypothetical protein